MAAVTVAGADGSQVTIDYPSAAYAALAQGLLDGLPAMVIDASGTYTLPADGPLDTVIGPASGTASITLAINDLNTSPDQVILAGDGTSLTLTAPGGGGTLIAGTGVDVLDFSSSDRWNVYTGTTGSRVTVGDGGGVVVIGGADTVTAGAGAETAFGAAVDGAQITGGSGTLLFAAAAGAATIAAGSGLTVGFGGSGQSTYDLSTGAAVVIGGPGSMIVNGAAAAAQMFGSTGSAISFTGSADNNVFVAGDGNETLNGSATTGDNSYFAGSGNDAITAGTGNDVLFGGTGNATLQGGGGANVFAFVDQAGSSSQDTIADFTAADTLDLIGGLTIASQDTSSGSLVVMLSDNTQLTFTGLTSDLSGNSITFT
jgi:Ca2+-binding RTX toxin-like protein